MQERCVVHEIGSSVDYRKMTSVWLMDPFQLFLAICFLFWLYDLTSATSVVCQTSTEPQNYLTENFFLSFFVNYRQKKVSTLLEKTCQAFSSKSFIS